MRATSSPERGAGWNSNDTVWRRLGGSTRSAPLCHAARPRKSVDPRDAATILMLLVAPDGDPTPDRSSAASSHGHGPGVGVAALIYLIPMTTQDRTERCTIL